MTATLATFVYIAVVAAMALMWVSAQEPASDRRTERAGHERRDPYIICGKGYENQEDRITMTRAITLAAGCLYVHISGQVCKCLRHTADGCAVLMDINTGALLTVCGCREYQDGKISYQIVENVRTAGAVC